MERRAAQPDGQPAGEIAAACKVPHNTMSTHLAALARAGLVTVAREGRVMSHRADLEGLRGLVGFLMLDCCGGSAEICAPVIQDLRACCAPARRDASTWCCAAPCRRQRSRRPAGRPDAPRRACGRPSAASAGPARQRRIALSWRPCVEIYRHDVTGG